MTSRGTDIRSPLPLTAVFLLGAVLSTAPSSAHAQLALTLDLGAAAGSREGVVAPVYLDGALSFTRAPVELIAAITTAPYSRLPGGTYGSVGGRVTWRVAHEWHAALGAEGGMGRRDALFPGDRRDVAALAALSHGAWSLEGRFSRARLESFDERGSTEMELSLRRDFGAVWGIVTGRRLSYADTQTVRHDTTYIVAGFPFRSQAERLGTTTRESGAGELTLGWLIRETQWVVRLGLPFSERAERPDVWGSATAYVPLRSGIVLVASGGQHPGIPEQRFAPSWFGTVGIRVAGFSPLAVLGAPTPPSVPQFRIVDAVGGVRLIVVSGIHAERVEINADFTQWEPAALDSAGAGVWQRALAIPPGTHRVVMRVDGGEWHPPPGLPVTSDGYGGDIGILFVEQ